MADRHLGPAELKTCLFSAAEYLENNYEILNDLNVFPVPDGDTGTNMLSTFEAGTRVLRSKGVDTLAEIAERMNAEMIRNSRGNSGFITARFFHGFFETASRGDELDIRQLAAGFAAGLFRVNSSLFSPVEGTMITIIRAMTETLSGEPDDCDIAGCISDAVASGRRAVAETPRLLPILAKAGVVDSGGLGFVFLMEGFLRGLTGEPVRQEREADYRFPPDTSGAEVEVDTRVFGYCTEVNVAKPHDFSREDLSVFLEERGNSIALVCEDDFLKLHIHTNDPAEIITHMKTLGTVEHVKIDNLIEEISRYSTPEDPEAACSVFACIPGEGFRKIFASLGVDHCMHYSSHLPAAGEITEYLDGIPEENVIILPNNNNILPAVMLAAEKSDKHVAVIHSGTIIQGIAASYGYSANDGIDDNVVNMKDCMDMAEGIFIYRSPAESEFDGQIIRKDDYFALLKGSLTAAGPGLPEVALESLEKAGIDEAVNITLYYQRPDMAGRFDTLRQDIAGRNPDCEVEILEGGQFREALIISME